jgi:hypothetical protein
MSPPSTPKMFMSSQVNETLKGKKMVVEFLQPEGIIKFTIFFYNNSFFPTNSKLSEAMGKRNQ